MEKIIDPLGAPLATKLHGEEKFLPRESNDYCAFTDPPTKLTRSNDVEGEIAHVDLYSGRWRHE